MKMLLWLAGWTFLVILLLPGAIGLMGLMGVPGSSRTITWALGAIPLFLPIFIAAGIVGDRWRGGGGRPFTMLALALRNPYWRFPFVLSALFTMAYIAQLNSSTKLAILAVVLGGYAVFLMCMFVAAEVSLRAEKKRKGMGRH